MPEVLEQFKEAIEKLPPLSQAASKLIKLTSVADSDDGVDMQAVVKLVALDPVLTASVFKVVNAPAYGLGRTISSITQAVNLLGYKSVAAIAVASCAPQVYNNSLDGYESVRGMLWESSFKAALIARELAKLAVKPLDSGVAFTAGIFHDIGKSVLSVALKGHSPEIIKSLLSGTHPDFLQAESTVAGNNHCEVGAALADYWHLPAGIKEAILYHHDPEKASPEYVRLVYAVHLGDALAMMFSAGTGLDSMQYELAPGYVKYFAINELQLYQIIMNTSDEFDKMRASLFN